MTHDPERATRERSVMDQARVGFVRLRLVFFSAWN